MEEYELQEYQMTQEEKDILTKMEEEGKEQIEIQKDTFNIQGFYDNINKFWMELATKYGIDWTTVQPSAQGGLFFLAEPLKAVSVNTTIEEEALMLYFAKDLYVPPTIKNQLKEIVSQIEEGCFSSTEKSIIEKDPAFIALRKMSQSLKETRDSFNTFIVPMTVKRSLKLMHEDLEAGSYLSSDKVPLESYPAFYQLGNLSK